MTTYAHAADAPNLPGSVYTDFANGALSTITLPAGEYHLPFGSTLLLQRSNVTVNGAGCILLVDPAEGVGTGFYPVQASSVSDDSTKYLPSPTGSGPGVRFISHATGTITAGSTTLTMDASEVVDLQVGETVLIWAGVTPSDPVEAQAFIPATVASVNVGTRVVTFTAPLGVDITNYVNSAGLAAVTEDGLDWKIGDWGTYPSDANFSKGYGTDHGIERFVGGGMVHDVTFNDLSLRLDLGGPAPGDMPNGMFDVSAIGVLNFTCHRLSIINPCGNALHLWRTFDAVIDTYAVSGVGLANIFTTNTAESPAIGIWGGDNPSFRNVTITGTDITVFNVEIGATGISLDGLNYDVTFTNARDYSAQPAVLGFFSTNSRPVVSNASIRAVTTGGSNHVYAVGAFDFAGDLVFPGTSLTDFLSFGPSYTIGLLGTVTLNGITYGPPITETRNYAILHGAGNRQITLPSGLYTAGTVQLTSAGDVRDIGDLPFGQNYYPASSPTVFAADKWHQIGSGGTALSDYVGKKFIFYLNDAGSTSDGNARFVVTYLPELVRSFHAAGRFYAMLSRPM